MRGAAEPRHEVTQHRPGLFGSLILIGIRGPGVNRGLQLKDGLHHAGRLALVGRKSEAALRSTDDVGQGRRLVPGVGGSGPAGLATFAFMELQDVQELSNFFERRVSAYQVGVTGDVTFDDDF